MTPDDLKEALEVAKDDALDIVDELIESEAPDGLTFDADKITDDREFIAYYIDLSQRPSPEFSILDFLPRVSPEVYESLTRRYERAIAKIGA